MKPAFLDELEKAFSCRQHTILHFNTADRYYWEEKRIGPVYLSFFLAGIYAQQEYRIAQYSAATGLNELNPRQADDKNNRKLRSLSPQQEPSVVLNEIISMLRDKSDRWLVLIHYGEHLVPANSLGISASAVPDQIRATELLHMLSMDDGIAAGASRAVIITYGEMPADLITRSYGYRVIQVNLPGTEERLSFINFLKERKILGDLETGLDTDELAGITAGMPLVEIEKLFRTSHHYSTKVTREQVKVAKARSIRQLTGDLLEVSEPEDTMEQVAGFRQVKEFLIKLRDQLRSGQKGVPQSILFNGVPGCGKSHVVASMANFLDWVLIQFRNVRGPYVGQSEQQLEHVIRVAEQFERCIIFFDEIDQLIGQRGTGASGDSGTSERMLARIMSWMALPEHRGRILFVGASNRPDLLDPAIVDRFKVSIPVLHPSQSEIAELFAILLKKFDRRLFKNVSVKKSAATLAPLRPTGRSLQEILVHAGLRADHNRKTPGNPIGMKHLMAAAEDYLPSETPLEMSFITLTSLSMCSANSLLPWMSMEGLRDDAEIPENLIADDIVDPKTGRLNREALHVKLEELQRARQYAKAMR